MIDFSGTESEQNNHSIDNASDITVTKATFIKTGNTDALHAEAEGLAALEQLIKQHQININIPKTLSLDQTSLTLEHIEQNQPSSAQWFQFGQSLAQGHLY